MDDKMLARLAAVVFIAIAVTSPAREFCHLIISAGNDGLWVALDLPVDPVRSLPHRLQLARHLFVRSMEKIRPLAKVVDEDPLTYLFHSDGSSELDHACWALSRRLQKLFEQPVPGKHVEAILGISAQERRRGSKDGRLPSTGHVTSTRTQRQFTLRVFSVDVLVRLSRDPEQIARWREADAETSRHSEQQIKLQKPTI